MENSTKAFYIVTGVLIGILVVTAFALVFTKGGQALSTIDNKEISRQIEEYNAKLIIYNRNNNTIFDVVTACNLAYDINNQNMFDNKNFLEIEFYVEHENYILENDENVKKGFINEVSMGEIKLTSLIEKYGQTLPNTFEYKYNFKGEVEYDTQTGKINKIVFTQI